MKHNEYYYIPAEQIEDDHIIFKGSEYKHMTIVTRKNPRDIIHVVDGVGNDYTVLLTDIDKKSARGIIQKRTRYTGESNFKLTLAQAVPRGSRFELVLEKCTELGVSEFIPLITENTMMKINETKNKRWKNITIASIKQCGRSVLPQISQAKSFNDFMQDSKIYDFKLIAHPETGAKSLSKSISDIKKKLTSITRFKNGIILVGPEAGFTLAEVALAKSNLYIPFNLGNRRLRSETAGIVSTAIMMEMIES